ncbi:MAG: radical SAM protein [Acidobacteria bacterium]|nr:radical SAM protein [Acidobacteriota bacterium]
MAAQPMLPILQQEPIGSELVGIARLAAASEHLDDGHGVEYRGITVRSLLNRCTAPRMPFKWTINPYRGCEFACRYCYARYTHEFMELGAGADFERKIFGKQRAAALLAKELARVKPGEEIAVGTATDPYQPAERRFRVTRSIMQELARHSGLHIGVVTKSNLVLEDLEILRAIARQNTLFVNLTVTTLDAALARILEPRAPRPDLRLEAVRRLNENGVPAGIICAPVMPGITDSPEQLEELVAAVAHAGGQYIFANALFLKPCSAAVFLPFVEREFPQLAEQYRRQYEGNAFLGPAYRKQLSKTMARLRRKYGVVSREEASAATEPNPVDPTEVHTQLALFSVSAKPE